MRRFFLFGSISAVGAGIDFVLVTLFLGAGAAPALAFAMAMCVSGTTVYILHQKLTFSDLAGRALSGRRLVIFLTTTIFVFGFRVVVFDLCTGAGLGQELSLILALTSSLFANYTVSRLWTFAGYKGGD